MSRTGCLMTLKHYKTHPYQQSDKLSVCHSWFNKIYVETNGVLYSWYMNDIHVVVRSSGEILYQGKDWMFRYSREHNYNNVCLVYYKDSCDPHINHIMLGGITPYFTAWGFSESEAKYYVNLWTKYNTLSLYDAVPLIYNLMYRMYTDYRNKQV